MNNYDEQTEDSLATILTSPYYNNYILITRVSVYELILSQFIYSLLIDYHNLQVSSHY